jgi:hypothetical protein
MKKGEYEFGDLVFLVRGECEGNVGIVSQPIGEGLMGHVLVQYKAGILGIDVSLEDIRTAEENDHGYAQLAYSLIKLGSHVIEQRLIV